MTKIELLKEFAKGWFGNSQQHSIHAQLLKQRGFSKLGDKIMAESDEEWEELSKTTNYPQMLYEPSFADSYDDLLRSDPFIIDDPLETSPDGAEMSANEN